MASGGNKKMWGGFVDVFGNTPRNRILEFLLEMKDLDFTIGDISREIELNRATTYNVMEDLINEHIVRPTRKISGTQVYKLNTDKKEIKVLLITFNHILEMISKKRELSKMVV